MKQQDQKIIYYADELNDEFSTAVIESKPVSKNYVYFSNNLFWQMGHFFWNRIFAYPITYLHAKIRFKWKVVNKKAFKKVKDTGYFIYGNHTQSFFDASMPKMISNKDAYVIVNPDNLNIKGLGWLIKKMGALPLPNDMASTKKFINAIDTITKNKKPILIYPEAHIWPYYTKIRPFKSTSFRYPVKYNVPAFCFTNTYQKRKNSKKPKIVTYVDGPFYPNTDLSVKEREQELRDRVYNCMVERSKNSNIEVIKYVKKELTND